MANDKRAWVIMSFGNDAAWEGNAGYSDNVLSEYQYDSFVPNSKQIGLGDVIIIRDRLSILGFAKVDELNSKSDTRVMKRCPICGTTKFNERVTKLPQFRCRDGHEYDQPTAERLPCTSFTIKYGDSFIPSIPPADANLLLPAYLNQGTQLSIRPVSLTEIRKIGGTVNSRSRALFNN